MDTNAIAASAQASNVIRSSMSGTSSTGAAAADTSFEDLLSGTVLTPAGKPLPAPPDNPTETWGGGAEWLQQMRDAGASEDQIEGAIQQEVQRDLARWRQQNGFVVNPNLIADAYAARDAIASTMQPGEMLSGPSPGSPASQSGSKKSEQESSSPPSPGDTATDPSTQDLLSGTVLTPAGKPLPPPPDNPTETWGGGAEWLQQMRDAGASEDQIEGAIQQELQRDLARWRQQNGFVVNPNLVADAYAARNAIAATMQPGQVLSGPAPGNPPSQSGPKKTEPDSNSSSATTEPPAVQSSSPNDGAAAADTSTQDLLSGTVLTPAGKPLPPPPDNPTETWGGGAEWLQQMRDAGASEDQIESAIQQELQRDLARWRQQNGFVVNPNLVADAYAARDAIAATMQPGEVRSA